MLRVVFTGPATDELGEPIVRKDLIAAAKKAGFAVEAKVGPDTQFLVASRKDTVKAREAEKRGIHVMDFAKFIAIMKVSGTEVVKSGADPDKWVDLIKKEPANSKLQAQSDEVPDFTVGYGGLL